MKKLIAKILKRKTTAQLNDSAITAIQEAAGRAAPKETGGILLGWWEEKNIVIDIAVEVVDHEATGNSWVRRQTEAQRVLDVELAKSGNPILGYVGDWHCHPAPVGASRRDLDSLAESSMQYPNPLALIVRLSDATVRVYAAERGRHVNVELRR